MTTRRTVLTGLAALPIAGQVSAVEASAPTPAPPEETSTAKPVFIHDIDRQLFDELKVLEASLARVLDRLRVANNPNPMIRSGALFDMRCSFQTLSMTADWARLMVEEQRQHADSHAREERFRRNLKDFYDAVANEGSPAA